MVQKTQVQTEDKMAKITNESTAEEIQEKVDLDHVVAMNKYKYLGEEKAKEFKEMLDAE